MAGAPMLSAPAGCAQSSALARGIVERKADELDADPDLLNTPAGVVDLRTGELLPHDPTLLMTKITSGSYRPGFTHPDWEKALEALPEAERDWLQVRIGQGITGHPRRTASCRCSRGSGRTANPLLTTDGLVPALGDYASMASPKLFPGVQGFRALHGAGRAAGQATADRRGVDRGPLDRHHRAEADPRRRPDHGSPHPPETT